MSIYLSNIEIPKEHPLYITLRPDGSVHVWDSYSGGGYGTQAIPVSEHGWLIELVSAKERLPEVGKPVLCACRANIYEVMKMSTDGAWVHNDAVYDSAYMGGFVTHWAELPPIILTDKEGE